MRFGWCVFPLLLGLATSASAFADPQALDPAAEAKRTALFEEGRKLHLDGKHAEAVVKLREVVAIRKSPQALRALGLAEQDAGNLLDARGHFEEAVRLAKENGPANEVEPASKAADEIAPRIPHIRVTLPAAAVDASLKIDGAKLVLKDGAVEVDPGAHTVTADAVGMRPFSQTVEVAAGGMATVDVALVPIETKKPPSIRRPIGLAVAGAGAAGLVVGAVTGFLAIAAHDDLAKRCLAGSCPDSDKSNIDAYHALGTTSTVSLIAGGVLAAGGAVLFFTAPRPQPASAVRVTPFIGAGTAGVRATF